jgi:hypothetical protein
VEDTRNGEYPVAVLLVYHGKEWILRKKCVYDPVQIHPTDTTPVAAKMCIVMINSLTTPEFETTPIGSLMTYVRKGVDTLTKAWLLLAWLWVVAPVESGWAFRVCSGPLEIV